MNGTANHQTALQNYRTHTINMKALILVKFIRSANIDVCVR